MNRLHFGTVVTDAIGVNILFKNLAVVRSISLIGNYVCMDITSADINNFNLY